MEHETTKKIGLNIWGFSTTEERKQRVIDLLKDLCGKNNSSIIKIEEFCDKLDNEKLNYLKVESLPTEDDAKENILYILNNKTLHLWNNSLSKFESIGCVSAEDVPYDNVNSELKSNNVQEAIDEIVYTIKEEKGYITIKSTEWDSDKNYVTNIETKDKEIYIYLDSPTEEVIKIISKSKIRAFSTNDMVVLHCDGKLPESQIIINYKSKKGNGEVITNLPRDSYSSNSSIITGLEYDHFAIVIDMNNENPTKGNEHIKYYGGCENFSVSDWEGWFGYKPVIMKVNDSEELSVLYECDKNNYKQSINGEDLTQYIENANQYKYQAMIQYPRRGYKINYDYSTKIATIYLTNDPCNNNYSYYAFNNGSINNSNLYVGIYPTTLITNNSITYALSGSTNTSPTKSGKSLLDFRDAYNNTSKYLHQYGYFEHIYFQIMHIAHFNKIDGYSSYSIGSTESFCGYGNSIGLNGGSSTYKVLKAFGLEILGGWEWIDNIKIDTNSYLLLNNTDNVSNTSTWEYVCKLNSCNGYIGNNIMWNEKIGLLAMNPDSSSNKYFHTDHIYDVGKSMLRNSYNIFNVTMNQLDSYAKGTEVVSRMTYKR